ncbi:2-nitropropane dioxygenase [Intrasporangium chromatireducens Q5-1]|uniref:2-nitropropane dioxygenase n=1 Tax=Intrasporangium chromatireducens Q5-1 TaxID=584657 RepID=W9GIT7_9MICO|nr:nitronate monooxygenase [Intrasporangium chromatireducens]EWT06151.1 2-nitropropane dioxygenase [Intrasporangium chromatireducens Q5-1]
MADQHPVVIQGGMGVNVSTWPLARAVAQRGQLGVVSGTALDAVLSRGLQDGDPGRHLRRALAAFPDPEMASRAVSRYFIPAGRTPETPYRPNPTLTVTPTRAALELAVLGNFVHVWLAKEGHDGPVGINFLEKIQMATPSAALGAMLAGVDYVLMGAGIPREIPQLLTDLAAGRPGRLTVEVHDATRTHTTTIEPAALLGAHLPALNRPRFLAIVSLHSLAGYLARDEAIRPDGFVVEGPIAGGHSAPPRGPLTLDEAGQPVYSARDDANLGAIAKLGLPFWLAGGYGTPERLTDALAAGAAGVQCGTLFALCRESGLTPQLRRQVLTELAAGTLVVRNDPRASPTAFPFKVAALPGTLSDEKTYAARPRLCDLSYLREPFERADGSVGYRCAAEPVDAYVRKGGTATATEGRKCLCNALTANVGLGQHRREGYDEVAAVTIGQDLDGARHLLESHPHGWTATEALDWLLTPVP